MNTMIPKISEKAFALSQAKNTYVFTVPQSMNKHTVGRVLKEQFDVDAVSVRVVVLKGKQVRRVINGRKQIRVTKSNVKKAYVVLKEGQSLPIYAGLTENDKAAEKGAAK